ncbi:hypothetical protein [uncultured Parabacteroides sp.]|uniref:hypothetical protein n=1 Tax=uncultured Parabacteroides sp. TaxID=512312 RepID=UPI0025D30871|nr:hypothetical protein [uncultured Parabacteroides sp.]
MDKKILYILFVFISVGCTHGVKDKHITCFLPQGTSFVTLVNSNEITDPYYYRELKPINKIAIICGEYCMIVGDSSQQLYTLPISNKPSDIHWLKRGGCLLSNKDSIYRIDETGICLPLTETQNKNVKLQGDLMSTIYFYHAEDTVLYTYDYTQKIALPVFISEYPIKDVKVEDDDIYIATGKEIILVTKDKVESLFISPDTIQSFAIGIRGSIFYATNKIIGYFDYKHTQLKVASIGAKDLQIFGNSLYIIFSDNSSGIIEPIFTYCIISDSLHYKTTMQ